MMKAKEHMEARGTGDPADDELMTRFKRGDAAAMEELADRHGGRLYGYLLRLTRDPDRASDAYQEVFYKVIKAAARYREGSNFSAWLFTIARNVVIDEARKDKHRHAQGLDDPVGEDGSPRVETVPGDGPDPEGVASASEMAAVIEEALAGLSREQREVFLLRESADMPFKEISKITGAPVNTVKTRMHYALNHIRKALKKADMLDG